MHYCTQHSYTHMPIDMAELINLFKATHICATKSIFIYLQSALSVAAEETSEISIILSVWRWFARKMFTALQLQLPTMVQNLLYVERPR